MESDNVTFSSLTEEILGSIQEHFNNIFDSLDSMKPKKFYRKIRTRKGIKRRYMIVYNPLYDYFLDELSFPVRFMSNYLHSRNAKL